MVRDMTERTMMPVRPRVALAEDHTLVREALRQLLAAHADVVGTYADGRSLMAAIAETRPDIVLLDISMPGLNGLEAARQLQRSHPGLKVIFVTMHADPDYVGAALRAGGAGYVIKSAGSRDLLDALAAVMAGKRFVSPKVAGAAAIGSVADAPPADPLTPRQREVLQLVAEGKTAREIAEILAVSRKTVEFHKCGIMRQLGLHTTAELTRYALERGLLGPS
jgi:DNA-binding NarL/FixJ family response regulator